MGKVLLTQFCLFLLYFSYKGIFCDENPSTYQQDSPPNLSQFSKLSFKDVLNMIEADRKDDFRYSKRSKANTIDDIQSTLVLEQLIDPMYDNDVNGEEFLKTNPLLLQTFAEKYKNSPQTRYLSPRLGRTADPSLTHHLPSLPPRFGKRNTVFTPRMG